jgi:N-acetylglucosamine-6-phosphate deacetylase
VTTALAGARIFDGTHLIDGSAVIIDGTRILGIMRDDALPQGVDVVRIEGLIAPGFVDVQVNGGGGVLFNESRTPEAIATIAAAHRRFGTTGFVPTLVTAPRDHMREALAAADAAISAGVPGVLGVHLEGPFLLPERKGAHNASLMRAPDEEDLALLTAKHRGRTLLTVAPEIVSAATIARLANAGAILSAGHTAADPALIAKARQAGLTGFTHLFNAMPPLAGRMPGPVGAALDDTEAFCGIIADLEHVSAISLRAAIAARGWERTMLVTDAMATVGSDIRSFTMDGRRIRLDGGRLVADDGTLAGAHLEMATAVRNAIEALGLPLEAALHMASRAPAEFLGLGDELGRIAPGYRASLVNLDDRLRVVETWIDGQSSASA